MSQGYVLIEHGGSYQRGDFKVAVGATVLADKVEDKDGCHIQTYFSSVVALNHSLQFDVI
jgi:hypothetical protein